MLNLRIHQGKLTHPVEALERYFQCGNSSIIRAAFEHSYFIHPDAVREKTPYFPDRARRSREHYPDQGRREKAIWPATGKEVKLESNAGAQRAWERYTGHKLMRGSGYGVRHIWGNPWDPEFYTAGWNLCYMPFWAGMLTEEQHQHPELERAIRQASWDLYFRQNEVCQPPKSVEEPKPKLDLYSLLDGQPILILKKGPAAQTTQVGAVANGPQDSSMDTVGRIKTIRNQSHQSWSNIRKAARALQDLEHEAFGTANVENGAKACVRKMQTITGLSSAEIEALLDEQGW